MIKEDKITLLWECIISQLDSNFNIFFIVNYGSCHVTTLIIVKYDSFTIA
jgi:hypothetical protein